LVPGPIEPRTQRCCPVLVGDLAGDARTGLGELEYAFGDVVLPQGREVRAERVRLDAVDADREVLLVDRADDVGAGDVQDLVAALEVLEVLEGRVLRLEHGAHRAVGHDHTGGQGFTEGVGSGPAGGAGGRDGRWQRGHESAP
jgi:hypothetical protein